jgi:hypothetical protein
MRVRRLTGTILLAAVMLVPGTALAQSPAGPPAPAPAALLSAPPWEASGLIGLGFIDSDPMVGGTWTLSGGFRVRQRLAIAVEVGRQGYGYAHDPGSTAHNEPFSGIRYLAGPRVQLSKHVFAHALMGAISTEIMPAQFSIRPGIGRDFGDEIGGLRIQVDYEIVPGQAARDNHMSGLRLLVGFVAFGGHR